MSVLSFREKIDSMLVGWASRAFFTELLAAGVKIYQFEGGLLHTKSVLVDGPLSNTKVTKFSQETNSRPVFIQFDSKKTPLFDNLPFDRGQLS